MASLVRYLQSPPAPPCPVFPRPCRLSTGALLIRKPLVRRLFKLFAFDFFPADGSGIRSDGSIILPARRGATELREQREGHGAVMLVGVLIAMPLAAAGVSALEYAPVFRATVPSETSVQPDAPTP